MNYKYFISGMLERVQKGPVNFRTECNLDHEIRVTDLDKIEKDILTKFNKNMINYISACIQNFKLIETSDDSTEGVLLIINEKERHLNHKIYKDSNNNVIRHILDNESGTESIEYLLGFTSSHPNNSIDVIKETIRTTDGTISVKLYEKNSGKQFTGDLYPHMYTINELPNGDEEEVYILSSKDHTSIKGPFKILYKKIYQEK